MVFVLLILLILLLVAWLDWRGMQSSRRWYDRPMVRAAGMAGVVIGWHTIGFILTMQILFGVAILAGLVAGFRQKTTP
jgi:hypothetical protein